MRIGRLAILGLLATLGGCIDADEGDRLAPGTRAGRPTLDEMVARLPSDIAGFKRDTVTEYEARQPGFGIAVAYAATSRTPSAPSSSTIADSAPSPQTRAPRNSPPSSIASFRKSLPRPADAPCAACANAADSTCPFPMGARSAASNSKAR